VTFVHHDKVEEIRRKLFVDVLLFLCAANRLVERKINFKRLIRGPIGNLRHRLTEWLEVVCLRLVGKDVAVKILGDGELSRAFKVTAAKFSESAKAKIEKAGGQAIVA